MKIIKDPRTLRKILNRYKKLGKTIGFVPTMGALHAGHLSLVRRARKENDAVVASIFVNPLQFGPAEDHAKYPRSLRRDADLLKREKIDFLFTPPEKTFYRNDFETSVCVKFLSRPLCGISRPHHFTGVCTVVLKLLNNVLPDRLYLGQKDYQQVRVVSQMVDDLDFPVKVVMAPIVREKDGLAMSSRNVYLSRKERQQAVFLHKALQKAAILLRKKAKAPSDAKKEALKVLKSAKKLRLDYFEIVDAQTLRPVIQLKKHRPLLLAGAVYCGKTRLIDNVLIKG